MPAGSVFNTLEDKSGGRMLKVDWGLEVRSCGSELPAGTKSSVFKIPYKRPPAFATAFLYNVPTLECRRVLLTCSAIEKTRLHLSSKANTKTALQLQARQVPPVWNCYPDGGVVY
ncbi:hypothetical protein GQ53DRAFT_28393 [Thozetella sp. PMI_491]|nr:hypothetical protein GQ53DRAFT_28393 [Thozetella sp. PMI_491]